MQDGAGGPALWVDYREGVLNSAPGDVSALHPHPRPSTLEWAPSARKELLPLPRPRPAPTGGQEGGIPALPSSR